MYANRSLKVCMLDLQLGILMCTHIMNVVSSPVFFATLEHTQCW